MSLTPERTAELQELCRQYRIDVLTAIHGAQSGHPGGSLSVCEILTLLYQQRMHVDAAHPDDPDRDRLVLCKGHAAPMLYRNLIGKGFLPPESMNTLRQTGSPLQGHPCMRTPGVDMPSGPLGIGLAAAQGIALGLKLNHSDARVYAVLGDGELDEGAVWEAAASAVKFGLDNLTAIVDWNKVQLDGTTDEIMPLRDLPGKWKAFGWNVLRCDGHDLAALDAALDAVVHVLLGLVVAREGYFVQESLAVGGGAQPVGGIEAGDDGDKRLEGLGGECGALLLGGIGREGAELLVEPFHGLHEPLACDGIHDALQLAELLLVVEVRGDDEGGAVVGGGFGEAVHAGELAQDAGEAHGKVGIEVLGAQFGDGASLFLQPCDLEGQLAVELV